MDLDREIAAVTRPMPPTRSGWTALEVRAAIDAQLAARAPSAPVFTEVLTHDISVPRVGGAVPARWYSPPERRSTAAAVYFHGGGFIGGSVDLFDPVVREYVARSGIAMLSVDYRLAPEAGGESPTEDGFAALSWLRTHASEYGVDPRRLAVMGDSAGGGLAAGVAVRARDAGIRLARQILIYPMLDDRTRRVDPAIEAHATWSWEWNATAWDALLDGRDATASIAPARTADLAGLATAYIEVGELDIFRDENIAYAGRLLASGVSTELHVHAGAPHGFDRRAPAASVSLRAMKDRVRVLRDLDEVLVDDFV